jgi:hypothetical protein
MTAVRPRREAGAIRALSRARSARPQFSLFLPDEASDLEKRAAPVLRLTELEAFDALLEFRGAWTPRDIDILREGLLRRLRWLRDRRVGKSNKQRLLEWLSVPFRAKTEVPCDPFSFQACCIALKVDPLDMKELVLTMCGLDEIHPSANTNLSTQLGFLLLEEETNS